MLNPIDINKSALNNYHELIIKSIDEFNYMPRSVVRQYINTLIKIDHLLGTDELKELRKFIHPDLHLNNQ